MNVHRTFSNIDGGIRVFKCLRVFVKIKFYTVLLWSWCNIKTPNNLLEKWFFSFSFNTFLPYIVHVFWIWTEIIGMNDLDGVSHLLLFQKYGSMASTWISSLTTRFTEIELFTQVTRLQQLSAIYEAQRYHSACDPNMKWEKEYLKTWTINHI